MWGLTSREGQGRVQIFDLDVDLVPVCSSKPDRRPQNVQARLSGFVEAARYLPHGLAVMVKPSRTSARASCRTDKLEAGTSSDATFEGRASVSSVERAVPVSEQVQVQVQVQVPQNQSFGGGT